MRVVVLVVILLVLTGSLAAAQEGASTELPVVPSIDVKRYLGTWYEVARLPNKFQRSCAGDVTATYSLEENGDLLVVNRCMKVGGEMSEAVGVARRASPEGPNSKLRVRFAPAFLSFLPFVWGDYWVILLAPDYSYAVVGEPERKYLWILSRTPVMEEELYQELLRKIGPLGYDLSGILRTTNKRQE